MVDSKKTAGERVKTTIICKHFIDAVEKKTYGWFWECPNGGDKCQYRHALPPDYVFKADREMAIVEESKLEDEIEAKRKELTSRTPVTFERLQEWLAAKKAKQAAAEAAELEAARKEYAKGKRSGVSGRMLFAIDASIFVDDASATDVKYDRQADDSDNEEEGEGGADSGATSAAAKPAAATTSALPPGGAAGAATAYASNYEEASKPAAELVAADVADLAGVDEALFLGEDLPDDDELADIE